MWQQCHFCSLEELVAQYEVKIIQWYTKEVDGAIPIPQLDCYILGQVVGLLCFAIHGLQLAIIFAEL